MTFNSPAVEATGIATEQMTRAPSFFRQYGAALRKTIIAPPGFWSFARTALEINFAIIAICWIGSWQLRGNNYYLFNEKRPGTLASVAVLILAGGVCFQIRKHLPSSPAMLGGTIRGKFTPLAQFFLAFGVLFCLAGLDDLFWLHERIDGFIHHLLGMDSNNRITDHLDDLIVLGYIVPAVYLGIRHRVRLIEAALAVQILTLAAVLFVIHVAFDLYGWSRPMEESLKLTAGTVALLAFVAIKMDRALLSRWRGIEGISGDVVGADK